MLCRTSQFPWHNSAKDVPNFCPKGLAARRKWGLGLITGGEHISRLVRREASAIGKTLTEEVLPLAKLEQRRYNEALSYLLLIGRTHLYR